MVENGHLKVKDGHLTLLACLPHSPQSGMSSLGTGKQFYIFVKVGYYPLLSLAVLAFYFIFVYCCLLSIIILFIGYTNVQSYGL